MYLSDGDLRAAIKTGSLIFEPMDPPPAIGPTSIDLHLDSVDQAQIWDVELLAAENKALGYPDLQINAARMDYGIISRKYLKLPPHENSASDNARVVKRDDCVVVRSGGFVLWQTKEIVGTPSYEPQYICFINGKSTRARTGLVVHLTAPTIHAGWSGNVTLEMTNCGPLDLVLYKGDAIAQLTVARITNPPLLDVEQHEAATYGQTDVTGSTPN